MAILSPIIKRAFEIRSKIPKILTPADGCKVQKRELKRLLRKANYTAFGEYYEFGNILRQKNIIRAFRPFRHS